MICWWKQEFTFTSLEMYIWMNSEYYQLKAATTFASWRTTKRRLLEIEKVPFLHQSMSRSMFHCVQVDHHVSVKASQSIPKQRKSENKTRLMKHTQTVNQNQNETKRAIRYLNHQANTTCFLFTTRPMEGN